MKETAEDIFQRLHGFGAIPNNVTISLTKNDIFKAMEAYAKSKAADAWDEACEQQIKIVLKSMPVHHLIRRGISLMQFSEYIQNSLKPQNPYK